MKYGVVFPQTEIGDDPLAIRDFAQKVEGMGFSHLIAYEHVVGANPDRPGGWQGPYTYHHSFHEPFILFSYLAAFTKQLGFATSILILPQRQTALVAKQAASLDLLCGGRFRLGVGLGWNKVEFGAMKENFHNRGQRIEEQVAVLRLLWTQPLVRFTGRWHAIQDVGINPLPIQKPIPIWFGGSAEPVLKRIARLGDGWMPPYRSASEAQSAINLLNRFLAEADRDPKGLGIEARLPYGTGDPKVWEREIRDWQIMGATHLSINTMGHGFSFPVDHLRAVESFAKVIEVI